MFICDICKKKFKTTHAVNGHMRIHSGIDMKKPEKIQCDICKKLITKYKFNKHYHNHKKTNCLECNTEIYDKKFCSISCSAKYGNRHREYVPKNDNRMKSAFCKRCGDVVHVSIRASLLNVLCTKCKKEKIIKIKQKYIISDDTREKLSKARIKSIKEGKTNFNSIKCDYNFKNKIIKCDSKIEYSCLDYFEKNYKVLSIERNTITIPYIMNGNKKLFLPDFKITTTDGIYLVEAKGDIIGDTLNKKWHFYKESSLLKKEALKKYCEENNIKFFWYTKNMNKKFYYSLKF